MSVRAVLVVLQVALAAAAAFWASDRATWPLFVAAAMAMVGCTALLYRYGTPRAGTILVVAAVMRLFWMPLAPGLSDDAYRYAWDGTLVADGRNPYQFVPEDPALAAYRAGPTFDRLNSAAFHSVYPPASQWLFGAASRITSGAWPASYFVLKAMMALLELAALLMLARMVPAGALMLVAWHPVLLITGAGQGHTESIALAFLVVAVWAARRRFGGLSGAALGVAGMAKLVPLLAVPVALSTRRGRVWAGAAAACLLLAAPFAAPFLLPNIAGSLDLYVRYFEFNAGPYYLLKKVYLVATGDDWSKQIGPALRLVFAASVLLAWAAAWKRRWPLERTLWAIYAAFLLTATTVHPWYLAPMILLSALDGRPGWAWQWLGAWSVGTYLLYTGGPYWTFVVVGWGGAVFLFAAEIRSRVGGFRTRLASLVQAALRRRARWKAAWIRSAWPADAAGPVLDVGGGEGYTAAQLQATTGRTVTVAEVQDRRRVDVPYVVYDGRRLPFDADSFAAACCVFVLHHAADAGALVREMARVTGGGPVVVIESVVRSPRHGRVLALADRAVNRLRGGDAGFDAGGFRTVDEWRTLFGGCGMDVIREEARYNPLHAKHLFLLVKRRSDPRPAT